MRRTLKFLLSGATILMLTACSYSMRGLITDISTGEPLEGAQVRVMLGEDRYRDTTTKADGKYRIKKDDRAQQVVYSAEGFEDYGLEIVKTKTKDVYLVPTPAEMARRITTALKDGNYEAAFSVLHPDYHDGLFSLEQFTQINASGFGPYLQNVDEIQIGEVTQLPTYRSPLLNKVYDNAVEVPVILIRNLDGRVETVWKIYLQKMKDANDREYYHWLFTQTINS